MNGPVKDLTAYPDQAQGETRLAWKKKKKLKLKSEVQLGESWGVLGDQIYI